MPGIGMEPPNKMGAWLVELDLVWTADHKAAIGVHPYAVVVLHIDGFVAQEHAVALIEPFQSAAYTGGFIGLFRA